MKNVLILMLKFFSCLAWMSMLLSGPILLLTMRIVQKNEAIVGLPIATPLLGAAIASILTVLGLVIYQVLIKKLKSFVIANPNGDARFGNASLPRVFLFVLGYLMVLILFIPINSTAFLIGVYSDFKSFGIVLVGIHFVLTAIHYPFFFKVRPAQIAS